jgi:hypothetical protein
VAMPTEAPIRPEETRPSPTVGKTPPSLGPES